MKPNRVARRPSMATKCAPRTCTTKLYHTACDFYRKCLILLRFEKLAGAVGFEPTHGATKTRCLTTWPRPKLFSAKTKHALWDAAFKRAEHSRFDWALQAPFFNYFCNDFSAVNQLAARHSRHRSACRKRVNLSLSPRLRKATPTHISSRPGG